MTLNELFDIYIEDVDMINQVTTTDSIKYRYKSHLKPFSSRKCNITVKICSEMTA